MCVHVSVCVNMSCVFEVLFSNPVISTSVLVYPPLWTCYGDPNNKLKVLKVLKCLNPDNCCLQLYLLLYLVNHKLDIRLP